MNKPWKSLMFLAEIVVKPADPSKPMDVEFIENNDYETQSVYETCLVPKLVSKDRRIQLGANSVAHMRYDYPEDFKKLVSATGDCLEAYRLYQALQKRVPDNWADYDEGSVWN